MLFVIGPFFLDLLESGMGNGALLLRLMFLVRILSYGLILFVCLMLILCELLVLEKAVPQYRRAGRSISVSAVPFDPATDIWRSSKFFGCVFSCSCWFAWR